MPDRVRFAAALAAALLVLPSAPAGPTAPSATSAPAEKPLARRIAERTLPSVFQAWNPAENLKGEPALVTAARHDLIFHAPGYFGLRWDQRPVGLAKAFTAASIAAARARRRKLLKLNPNLVLLAEVRYRDAGEGFLPEGHKWWAHKDGKRVPGWKEGGFFILNFQDAEYRQHVAVRCKAVVATGVVDGVMLDWWIDDDHRLALARAVRQAVGEKALILVNANDRTTPRTAPYVNGYFMECYRSRTVRDWQRIAHTLTWAEKNLRAPRVNCLETWFHQSRRDLRLMRATTTLCLTHSDGYCLFSDPNPLPKPDHLHDWYPFWDRHLGKPTGPGRRRADKATERDFDNGTAVYNPPGNKTVTLTFDEQRLSLATGKRAREHALPAADGDIYLNPGR